MKLSAHIHHQHPDAGLVTELGHALDMQNLRVLMALSSRRNFHAPFDSGVAESEVGFQPRQEDGDSIPKIIYQTWKSNSLPPNYGYWRDSFRRVNPDFQILLWTDSDNLAFVREYFPGILDLYSAFPREIFRVDLIRPLFLLQFGGYYFDLDCEAIHPIGDRWGSKAVVLGRMGDHDNFPHSLPNATLGSLPGEIFWLVYVGYIIDAASSRTLRELEVVGPETITGPIALWRTYGTWVKMTRDERAHRAAEVLERLAAPRLPSLRNDEVHVASRDEMFALDWNNRIHQRLIRYMRNHQLVLTAAAARRLFPGAISATYWSHSWGYGRSASESTTLGPSAAPEGNGPQAP